MIPLVIVSGRPPLLVMITAQPQLADSKLVLPNGSSHLEQTTDIEVFLKIFKTSLCSLKPRFVRRSCLNSIFSFPRPLLQLLSSFYSHLKHQLLLNQIHHILLLCLAFLQKLLYSLFFLNLLFVSQHFV